MTHQTPIDTTDELEETLSPEETVQEIKKKSVTGVVSYFLRTLVLQGIGFVSAAILTGFFSPEDFGIYGYVTQIIGLLIFFSDIGFAGALIQQKEHPSDDEYKTAFTVQQTLAWLIFSITVGLSFSQFVVGQVGEAGRWVLIALGLSFPLASLKTIPSIQLERQLDFSKLVIPQILEQIVFHSILIFLAIKGAGVMAYTYAIGARSVIGVVSMYIVQPWRPGIKFDTKLFKKLFAFGSKFQLIDFIARIKDQLFFLVLGKYLPLREFGYVSWAKNWSLYPYNLTVQNVMSITFPTFSRLQEHQRALQRAIEKSLFFITLLIFPLLIGMSVFIRPVLEVTGLLIKWQPALASFILFTLSIGWSAISSPLTNALTALGKINTTLKLMIMWTGLTWTIAPITILRFGFNGVAIASFIIAITSLLPLYYMKKLVEIRFIEQIWRQLLAAGVMALVGVLGMNMWSQSFVRLGFGMIIVAGSYGLVFGTVGWKKLWQEIQSLKG